MGVLDWAFGKLGYVKPAPRWRGTGFDAAQLSNLTASLQTETQFINTTLRFQLRILRARSRQAAMNNPFAKRFFQMVVDNVAGPTPFRLEGDVRFNSGEPDETANDRIEACWKSWAKKGSCEITGQWSWNAVQRLLVKSLAMDGEILVRKLRGPEYGRHGFQLQLIDVDRLWEYKNQTLPGGGAIHAGIEVDASARPVAYHILKRKPAQWQWPGYTLEFDRIPAEDIIHVFVPDFSEQHRGMPWIYAALLNLVHLGAFEEAAVIAARIGAANMGFIQSPDGGKSLADQAGAGPRGDGTDALGGDKGDPQISAQPGAFWNLPPGYTVGGWNPKYPDAAIKPFVQSCLRGIASGLGVAYHNLANDLEGVNYSSARIGELDERDMWMGLQGFTAEHLHQPLYEDWLPMQALTGQLAIPAGRLEKYKCVYWQGKRWAWVDPLKEVGANVEALNARMKSLSRVIAEGGDNIEDVFKEIQYVEKLARKYGIDLTQFKPAATGTVDPNQADGGSSAGDGAGGQGKGRALDRLALVHSMTRDQ